MTLLRCPGGERRVGRLALLGLILLSACRGTGDSATENSRTSHPVVPQAEITPSRSTASPVEDETTRALRERYEGREVWVYGGGPLTCRTGSSTVNYTGSPLTAVRVISLSRVRQRTAVPLRGGTLPPQEVDTPILLRVRVPKSFQASSGSTTGTSEDWFELARSETCQEFTELYVDEAHLSRELSLTPPPDDVKEVLHRFDTLPPEHEQPRSSLGLTHRQALWLKGAPESPLTDLDTLLRAGEWAWIGPPGRGDWTLTFQDDRVIAESRPSPSP